VNDWAGLREARKRAAAEQEREKTEGSGVVVKTPASGPATGKAAPAPAPQEHITDADREKMRRLLQKPPAAKPTAAPAGPKQLRSRQGAAPHPPRPQ
jgi:hypothetical protein